jgi:hypothetical protein
MHRLAAARLRHLCPTVALAAAQTVLAAIPAIDTQLVVAAMRHV